MLVGEIFPIGGGGKENAAQKLSIISNLRRAILILWGRECLTGGVGAEKGG